MLNETVLVPVVEWSEYFQEFQAYIMECDAETMDVVFAWSIRESPSPFECLEAVTAEWVRMMSNTINYYLEHDR